MTSIDQAEIKKLVKELIAASNSRAYLAFPALVYMLAIISGLSREEGLRTAAVLVPFVVIIFTVLVPPMIIKRVLHQAFAVVPGEPEGARLERILKVPRKVEVGIATQTAVAVILYTSLPAVYYGKSLWTVPWAVIVISLLMGLMQIQHRLLFDRIMRPYALAEFHRNPEAIPKGAGIFWVRQRWYLPYVFGIFVASTLATSVTVIIREGSNSYQKLLLVVRGGQVGPEQFVSLLESTVAELSSSVLVPLCLLGAYLLLIAAISAWALAKYQTEGAQSVQQAMESLASGKPKLPDWVSSDEIGDLAAATAKAFGRLKTFSFSLGESAQDLWRSAEQLGLSTSKQTEALTHQATALQETQVTAQEIKQTSALTAQKAEGILKQTERADEISRAGELAIQQSLNGLQEIGEQVKEMAKQIRDLDQRTRQIANITTTVKDLADQSNMLALNAAIEAVRSGEHGKGFGVVAREIRTLADQSIRATNNVRSMLQDISSAIRATVSMTEKGTEKVASSLTQVREFGDNIRQLSGIVRENAASVRQITAAVTQQNTGITQIFQAVSDLSTLMDQTMVQLRTSDEALERVRAVTDKVASMAGEERSDSAFKSTLPHPAEPLPLAGRVE